MSMISGLRRPAVAILLLTAFWPTLVFGQAPKAGVVTTLQGEATVARPVLPQPVAIKFKDDVFIRDRIDTREQSIVRLLLGGKAVVTVRELSSLTVTEEPNRAVIDLREGKVAVGVARSLLKPGESIEVHTPNAVAGIRGSLLVATVRYVEDPVRGRVPKSEFTALQATVPITVAPKSDPTATVPLNAREERSVTGTGASTTMSSVVTLTTTEVREKGQAAEAPKAKEQTEKAPEKTTQTAANVQSDQAAKLATILAPPKQTEPQSQQQSAESQQQQQQQPQGADPSLAKASAAATPTDTQTGPTTTATTTTTTTTTNVANVQEQVISQAATQSTAPPPPPAPDVTISGTTQTVASGQTLTTFSGTVNRTATSPVFAITNGSVNQTGTGNLIDVTPGANVTLNGPLAQVRNTTTNTISTGGDVVNIAGNLTSRTTLAFLDVDPTTVIAAGNLFQVTGSLSLAGTLASFTNATLQVGNSVLNVAAGGNVSNTSSSPLVLFTGSVLAGTGVSGGTSNGRFFGSPFPSLSPLFGTRINFDDLPSGVVIPATRYAAQGVASLTQIDTIGGTIPPATTFGGSQSPPNYVTAGLNPFAVERGTDQVGSGFDGRFRIQFSNPTNKVGVGIADSIGADTLIIRDANLTVLDSFVAPFGANTYEGFTRAAADISFLEIVCDFCAFDDLQFNAGGPAGPVLRITGNSAHTGIDTETEQTFGTDTPLVHTGVLVEASGSTMSAQKVLQIDAALLVASASLLNLKAGSTFTSSVDAVDLGSLAKVTAVGPAVKLDASTLNVLNGSLFRVAGGLLKVTGDLVSLANGSTLNITGGGLVTVSGGGFFKLTGGSLGAFGTGTNTINITNTAACSTGCSVVTSIPNFAFPVLLRNSASAANVTVASTFTPFSGLSSVNRVNVSGTSGAVLVLDGVSSRIRLGP